MKIVSASRLVAFGLLLLCAAVWSDSTERETEQAEATQRFLDNPGFTRDWSRESLERVRDRDPAPTTTAVRTY